MPLGYYQVTLEQEAVVMEAGVPWSIVRATQFHQLLAETFGTMARFRLTPRSPAPLQPVDPAEVAFVVADVLEGAPLQSTTTVAGPEIRSITELSRLWSRAAGKPALPLRIPMLGRAGRAVSAGGLTTTTPATRGEVTFERWLEPRPG